MRSEDKQWRAIDLYSGVGGWSLGLRLAGIDVVASYERWGEANETNFKNNQHQAQTIDIRRLELADLPQDIDVVVGSPPCTEFSYSNRGGGGDIDDGLRDIKKFLSIVAHMKPKAWAMENVPRVAAILRKELAPGGQLSSYRHLNIQIAIVDMSEFGLPQRRVRCIAGSFDPALLQSYAAGKSAPTLGTVVTALQQPVVRDPIYNITCARGELTDNSPEEPLTVEEVRINRAGKVLHPVYNAMPFPDSLTRAVRTITATCTRVSRESVVIRDPKSKQEYRRLTIRERASLQGFPITFQFYASSHGNKAKMVGNAVPPFFAYFVGHALKGSDKESVSAPRIPASLLKTPNPPAANAKPPRPGNRYSDDRRFRFSVPSLHMKSGVRFDLTNGRGNWHVEFFFGTSKSIHELKLTPEIFQLVTARLPAKTKKAVVDHLERLKRFIAAADIEHMQRIWAHKGVGLTAPFMLLDQLDDCGASVKHLLLPFTARAQEAVGLVLVDQFGEEGARSLRGLQKLSREAVVVWSGLLVGSMANMELAAAVKKRSAHGLRLSAPLTSSGMA